MSGQHATPDRMPAFMGLIFGAIAICAIVYAVSMLTAKKYAGHEEGAKSTASAQR